MEWKLLLGLKIHEKNKTTVVRRSFFSTLGHLCNQECLYISVFDAFYMGQVGKALIAPKKRLIH